MKRIACAFLLGAIMIFTACGPSPEQVVRRTADALTATAAGWTPTPTGTAPPSATSTATSSSTQTITPTRKPPTPTFTASTTPTRDPRRYYSPDGFFSVVLPFQWKEDEREDNFLSLRGPFVGRGWLEIMAKQWEINEPLAEFTAAYQDMVTGEVDKLTNLGEDFLRTDSGETYFRWECEIYDSASYHHILYYFYGTGIWKLVIAYDRLRSQSASYDDRINTAMQTVIYNRPDPLQTNNNSGST